eukprot:IDg3157t1
MDAHLNPKALFFWAKTTTVEGVIRDLFFNKDQGEKVEEALSLFKKEREEEACRGEMKMTVKK